MSCNWTFNREYTYLNVHRIFSDTLWKYLRIPCPSWDVRVSSCRILGLKIYYSSGPCLKFGYICTEYLRAWIPCDSLYNQWYFDVTRQFHEKSVLCVKDCPSSIASRSSKASFLFSICFAAWAAEIKPYFPVNKLHHSICLLIHKTGSKDQRADAIIFGRDAKQFATKATRFEKKRHLVCKFGCC